VLWGLYESKLKILEALWKILKAKCEIIKYQESQNVRVLEIKEKRQNLSVPLTVRRSDNSTVYRMPCQCARHGGP
jgi:hypothetical protein